MALFSKIQEAGSTVSQHIASSKTLIFWLFATIWVSWDAFVYGFSPDYFKWRMLGYVSLGALALGLLELEMPFVRKVVFVGITVILQLFVPMIPSTKIAIADSLFSLGIIVVVTYFWTWFVGIYFNKGFAATMGKLAFVAIAVMVLTSEAVFSAPSKFADYQTAVKTKPAMDLAAKAIKSAYNTAIGLPSRTVSETEAFIRKTSGLPYETDVQKTTINSQAAITVDGSGIRTDASSTSPYKIYLNEITTLSVPLKIVPFKNPNGETIPFMISDIYCSAGNLVVRSTPSSRQATESFTARCMFEPDSLSRDLTKVNFRLLYSFDTKAILPVYVIDQETSASIKAQNQNPIEFFLQGNADLPREPVSKYTLGPGKLGIGTDPKYLLEIPATQDPNTIIYAGISLEKDPSIVGGFGNITSLKLDLPEGLEIAPDTNSCGRYRFSNAGTADGYTSYLLDARTNYKIESDFVRIECKLAIADAGKILPRSKFDQAFIGASVSYDFSLSWTIPVEVLGTRNQTT